jgi:hypothetical protein
MRHPYKSSPATLSQGTAQHIQAHLGEPKPIPGSASSALQLCAVGATISPERLKERKEMVVKEQQAKAIINSLEADKAVLSRTRRRAPTEGGAEPPRPPGAAAAASASACCVQLRRARGGAGGERMSACALRR